MVDSFTVHQWVNEQTSQIWAQILLSFDIQTSQQFHVYFAFHLKPLTNEHPISLRVFEYLGPR